jgi:asparagine synthase (glutamine-hydrolysing)
VAGDLLPPAVTTRTTKAVFTSGVFREPSRAFARTWDGTGVDPTLVDPELLRATWLAPEPDARSFLLLHQAWLAGEAAAGR